MSLLAEMEKSADMADKSVLFFSAGANFWALSAENYEYYNYCFISTRATSNRGERERLFGSREREGKLKIPFPFYGKGTGFRKCYVKGREWEI